MSDSYRGGWDLGKILKVPNIRKGLLFTLLVLVITRLGAQIPVPGVSRDVFSNWFANQQSGAVSLFDMMTGGSFSQMSIFALSITPYITASIIMQLMTIIIPSLEELQKDQDGRDKINEYTFYLSIGLSALQAVAMGIAFYRSNSLAVKSIPAVIVVIVALITGAVVLIFLGEEITKHGVGNGISMILLFNIVSRMPQDIGTLYDAYLKGRNIVQAGLAFLIILAIILFMIAFCVCLQDAYVRIPVQNSSKMVGRRAVGGVGSNIPFMINASNVIPVIFAGSLMSLPELITSFTGYQAKGAVAWIFNMLSQNNWFNPDNMSYTVGYILYAVLIIAFAYFYTSIMFNPQEVAERLKERGSFIPGQRPGRQTVEYLQRVSDTTIVIGAIGLLIVSTIPIVLAGLLGVDVSFGGTSIIIIVGVVLETIRKLDSQVSERHLRGLFSSNR
ncbi:MAG: preprotein translocase subunit SecY [Lachnospiraceae bacterium]|jgi:preprotein translocase subunit SecY